MIQTNTSFVCIPLPVSISMRLGACASRHVSDVHSLSTAQQVRIEGLAGREYLDNLADKRRCAESAPALRFSGEVDRIYLDVPGRLRVRLRSHRNENRVQGSWYHH